MSIIVALVGLAQAKAQTPPDADLYYRRTHGGAPPPPGFNASDHSYETAPSIPATDANVAPKVVTRLGLDNGINPTNLGKGDWIWQMPQTETHLGLASGDVQGVINYEVSMGMQWITVKCGDGGSIWTQFTADLVNRAHAAGLKIFGWGYAYGSSVSGEINVAVNALNLGADGFIIDAEGEYEVLANNAAAATNYCQGIRAAYPNRFLAHAPFPYLDVHSGFPYATFGTFCNAVMPQDYWGAIGTSPENVVVQMNTRWRTWQNAVALTNPAAIKPIAPLGQSYAPVTGAEITRFLNALVTNTPMATAGGYKSVSFWDAQERTADMDSAVRAASIGNTNTPPVFLTQPTLSRALDAGASVSYSASASGPTPISYQWKFNGAPIAGAIGTGYTLSNAQSTNSGFYSVVASNANGYTTSQVVSVTVYPPQTVIFSDNFDANSAGNWTVNQSSADTRVTFNYDYSANGIVSAPHSTGGTTRGVKFEANMTAGVVAALSISPTGQKFPGDYRLHFDMWINANGPFPGGGTGSTEELTAGIGTAGNRVQWTGAGTTADGYWFAVDGDGGVTDTSTTQGDYDAFAGTTLESTGSGFYYSGTDATARGNLNAYYLAAIPGSKSAPALQQSTYPQQTGALAAGTAGFAWHDVIVSRRGNVVEWSIDGFKLASISGATFTASNIFIGYWDPFASVSDNAALSFGLVDNVRVETAIVAPSISAQPQGATLNQGTNWTFSVTASGTPAPAYQWRFYGTNLVGATASSYSLPSVQGSNAGPYTVVVTNAGGSLTSLVATLNVNIAPTISAQPQDRALNPGSNATFTVAASGTPPPAYQWLFYGTNLSGATGSSYTVFNAQPADVGPYSVQVTNVAGSITSSPAALTLNMAPMISVQPQDMAVKQGSNATFTVTATGTAPLSYQWQFGAAPISGATASSYTVTNVQTNNIGNYSVLITNTAGAVASSNALLSLFPPQPAHFDLIELLPDHSVHLRVTAEPGRTYAIEASSNIIDWMTLTNIVDSNGVFDAFDAPATNGQSFYRARLLP